MGIDQFKTTQNGGNVCNLKVVHNHQLTWINLLWSTTMYASTKLSAKIVPWDKIPSLFEDLGNIHHSIATKLTTGDAGSLIRKEEIGGETEE